MEITYNKEKNQLNIAKHGLSFEQVADINWEGALITLDERKDYKESSYIATAIYNSRLHIVVFTTRQNELRVISFRKANKREVKSYEQANN